MLCIFREEIDWTPKQDLLRKLLKNPKNFDAAISLALEMHAMTHSSEMTFSQAPTIGDEVWDGLVESDFSIMPTRKDVTIAWNIWHITRIEDLNANILIADSKQILDDEWLKKLNITVLDTGNAMSDKEIIELSKQLNKQELRNYRNAVGRRTREVLRSLTPGDIKGKPKPENLDRLVTEGGILEKKGSIWLKDFWGDKTVGGLILLPITRHQVMHLPDCINLKNSIKNSAV